MKPQFCSLLLISTCQLFSLSAFSQGSTFTYQGRLNSGGGPASGTFDLRFTMYDALTSGNQIGGALTNTATAVTNGLFTSALDFGPGVFTGSNLWLEIAVRTNGGGALTTLSPRQPITPSPYSIFAENASGAGISGPIASGNVSGTYSNTVNFNNGADTFDGSFYGQFFGTSFVGGNFVGSFIGSGSGLSDVWHTGGNLGTTAGPNFVGTTDNQPLELHVNNQRALRLEPNNAYSAPNVIGGASVNVVSNGVFGATIAGGGAGNYGYSPNRVGAIFGTISGGRNNYVGADHSSIGGGHDNFIGALSYDSVIAGGASDTIFTNAVESTIGGGNYNSIQANGSWDFIGRGYNNSIQLNVSEAVVGGGGYNTIQANSFGATISGGYFNSIQPNASEGFIGGGSGNTVGTNASGAAVAGGFSNRNQGQGSFIGAGFINLIQETNDYYCFIGSGYLNSIGAGNYTAIIGGGYDNQIQPSFNGYSTISGGALNVIGTNGGYSSIGGGSGNQIQANANYVTIAGGSGNLIGANAYSAFIGGGSGNQIQAGSYPAISGGLGNLVGADGDFIGSGANNTNQGFYSVIGGGIQNTIGNTVFTSEDTIGGGFQNSIQASSSYCTVGGGGSNIIGGNGFDGTIGGGAFNTIQAGTTAATIPGGYSNSVAGYAGFAAGQRAKANHNGAFVWGDFQNADFVSSTSNQFLIRANGGVGIGTNQTPPGGLRVHSGGLAVTGANSPNYGNAQGVFIEGSTNYGVVFAFDYGAFQPKPLLLNSPGGNVGIGTASPDATLSVNGSADKPGGGSWSTFSDARLKDIGAEFDHGLEDLARIQPVHYHYKADNPLKLPSQPEYVGVIAQQIAQAIPEAVERNKDGYLTVNNDPIIWTMVNAIKQLNQRTEDKVQKLQSENAELKARLEKLEHLINGIETSRK